MDYGPDPHEQRVDGSDAVVDSPYGERYRALEIDKSGGDSVFRAWYDAIRDRL